MALVFASLTLAALFVFCLGFASFGNLILRKLGFQLPSETEHLLLSIAVGLLSTEILLFLSQFAHHIRAVFFGVTGLLAVLLIAEWKAVFRLLTATYLRAHGQTRIAKLLLCAIACVAVVEFLMCQAPLTGSDALNYHFAFQKLILKNGFHPVFSSSPTFLCGQQHLLILFGLGLQGERLALGFIFLGGLLTTACLAQLISRWASGRTAALFSLLFLLTPIVFWQISTSGAPDIFMSFLAGVAVITLSQAQSPPTWKQAVVAGFVVGGIAGAKYTGVVIAAAFFAAAAIEFESLAFLSCFAAVSLFSGIWPYLRNWIWTRDPVFPFLATKLCPNLVTNFGMADLAAQTGASSTHSISAWVPFVFLASAQTTPGLWDFFGPTVLALAPLMLLAFRNVRAWRIPLVVWLLSSTGIYYGSGLPRFLLPIFPIALSCVSAGYESASRRSWKIARTFGTGLIVILIFAGAAGLAKYSARPLLAATGTMSKTKYLEESSPDYQIAERVNQSLSGKTDSQSQVLVFVRHTYYLEVPYRNGDPRMSFEVDPDRLQTSEAWKRFFEEEKIGFVVRSPDYPESIEKPLLQLERDGDLVPTDQLQVQNFEGNRIEAIRTAIPVIVLRVKR
jgi:hypothetical protein